MTTNADRIIAALFAAATTASPRPRYQLPEPWHERGRREPVVPHGPVTPFDPLVIRHAFGTLTVHRNVESCAAWAERVHRQRAIWNGAPQPARKPARFPWPREHVEPDPE